MNEFKFQITSIALVAVLAFSAYWSFTKISNGTVYRKSELVSLENQGVSVDTESSSASETPTDQEKNTTIDVKETAVPAVETSKDLSADEKALVQKLEALIEDDIYMKRGSYGTRVGTVQKFLNIYFDQNKNADNDYGPGTLEDVKKFQSKEGLNADGQAGPNTYKKMIEVLKK